MCSCCCKKSRQGKGCCTWMVHGVLANFLSLANLLNFLLSVFILGYSVYILKLRSYHLDVPAIVLLYTGGLSFLFSLCFICGLRNKYFLMTYVFHTFLVVLIQSGTYILYMNHEWHKWINSHLIVAPHWAAVIIRHHIKTTKVILTVSFSIEIALLVLSTCVVCFCDSKDVYRSGNNLYDEDDDGYFDDDIDVASAEEVNALLAADDERLNAEKGRRRESRFRTRRDELFRKYQYYDDDDNTALQW